MYCRGDIFLFWPPPALGAGGALGYRLACAA
jgi:hypothetical protein